ncbi:hypothetical protein DPMN_167575 [Dreissena polymorpha]|uniref:Uncharacterized protein n=1 Tax=Dreissena polymorpha TaxID=45954 RepID=A0A9D4IYQ7_DREPO|nr:hypothetical protein DPMN_167575 [Dreissena polymorpha]
MKKVSSLISTSGQHRLIWDDTLRKFLYPSFLDLGSHWCISLCITAFRFDSGEWSACDEETEQTTRVDRLRPCSLATCPSSRVPSSPSFRVLSSPSSRVLSSPSSRVLPSPSSRVLPSPSSRLLSSPSSRVLSSPSSSVLSSPSSRVLTSPRS